MIAEFQASNLTTIQDEDGDFSDWVEIRNDNSEPIDITGWYLTDDPARLTKWKFPNVTIAANDEIIVFASSKNRTEANRELHTNFKLAASGEYLALVRHDGITIEQDFGASYPALQTDQSYGLSPVRNTQVLSGESAPVKFKIPLDNSLGTEWTKPSFNDADWRDGINGIGFEIPKSGFVDRDEFDGLLDSRWKIQGDEDTYENSEGALRVSFPSPNDDTHPTWMAARDVSGEPANWEFVTHIQKDRRDLGTYGIGIIDEQNGNTEFRIEYFQRSRFQVSLGNIVIANESSRSRDSFLFKIVRDGIAQTWSAYFRLEEDQEWTLLKTVQDGVSLGPNLTTPVVATPMPALLANSNGEEASANFLFAELSAPDQPAIYEPHTLLAGDTQFRGVNSSVYIRIPFLFDTGQTQFQELDLTSIFDDGFIAYLNGVKVASQNSPSVAKWNSTALNTHGATFGRIPTVQFAITDAIPHLQDGANVLAIHGLNIDLNDDDFFAAASLFGTNVLDAGYQFFTTPSPNHANEIQAAPAPQISGKQGVFFGSTTVELSIDKTSPIQEIRYTLDGSEPTRFSTRYSEPIVLTESAMLQARTFDVLPMAKSAPSAITSGTWVALSDELRSRTSDIPLVFLDTLGRNVSDAGGNLLVPTNTIAFQPSNNTGRTAIDDTLVNYLGRAGARERGSSTLGQPKPNMTFETWGPNGSTQDDDSAIEFLGLAADSDWVLYAPYSVDPAMIRNQFAFELSNQMGHWAPHYRAIEVYLNRDDGIVTEDDYAGVYILFEKIKQGPDRVDVQQISTADNSEPEITGGYIWKIDRPDPDAPGFAAGGQPLNWVEPKSPISTTARDDQKATVEQQDWVVDHFESFAQTLIEPDLNDPEGYSKYIDVNSWIDQHLLNVFLKNVDGLRLSTFLHKDRQGKIAHGPPWDFDRSAGSADGRDRVTDVWIAGGGTDYFGPPHPQNMQAFWSDMFRDIGFWQLYIDRWQDWRNSVLSEENLDNIVNMLADPIRESAERNFASFTDAKPRRDEGRFLDGTYQGEIDHLRNWLSERGSFIDSNFAQPPEVLFDGEPISQAKQIQLSAGQEIEIRSPRLLQFDDIQHVSGKAGATIASYFVPTDDDLAESWTAIDFDDSTWEQGPTGLGFESQDNFTDLIQTVVNPRDVKSTTILARMKFEISDLTEIPKREFLLRMKYDDGFVAYLNGVEVLRQGLRDEELSWNSRAIARQIFGAPKFEDFNLSPHKSLLQLGTNVLAIRGINSATFDRDMLILPELVSRQEVFVQVPTAKVYYTEDGTDPRGPDGDPSESAREILTGETLALQENSRIIARNLDDSDRGPESEIVLTDWSSPIQIDVSAFLEPLVISEINYHPFLPTETEIAAGFNDADDFEFIEIVNRSDFSQDLSNLRLVQVEQNDDRVGVAFDFSEGDILQLEPNDRVLVVEDSAAFKFRYGDHLPIAGQWSGGLSNSGELLSLFSNERLIQQFRYDDAWYIDTDGRGKSLQIVNVRNTNLDSWSLPESWQPSAAMGGTPGRPMLGDFNSDGSFNAMDVDLLFIEIRTGSNDLDFDLNQDLQVNDLDRDRWLQIAGTGIGDANLDRIFNSADLVHVFQFAEYEDSLIGNSTWEEGDWNGDGEFSSSDLVLAFQFGNYSRLANRD